MKSNNNKIKIHYWFLAIRCSDPPEIENGEIFLNSNNSVVGTVVEYSCVSLKYRLVGPKQIICLPTGQYDKPAPQCKGNEFVSQRNLTLSF